MNLPDPSQLKRWSRYAGVAAVLGLGISAGGLWIARAQVVQAWWVAWIFWVGLSFGSLVLLMMHSLTGGAWGEAIRAVAIGGAKVLPVMALLFLPPLLAAGDIFPWLHAEFFAGGKFPHQHAYLTLPWFLARGLGCLVAMSFWTFLFGLWRSGSDVETSARSGAVGAGGLLLYVVCMLFVSTDWILSLEPHWYSTMLVVIFGIEHILAALAFTVFMTLLFSSDSEWPVKKQLHDLGNLLLAFVMFWAYITFSQYLITWSGNLPREIAWYRHRSTGGWTLITAVLALMQFAVPFALLLSRKTKRHRRTLAPVAALVFGTNALHVWWLIAPSLREHLYFPIWELAALLGLGGAWGVCFLRFLPRNILPPAQPVEKEVAHA